jgi:hypothetical protein
MSAYDPLQTLGGWRLNPDKADERFEIDRDDLGAVRTRPMRLSAPSFIGWSVTECGSPEMGWEPTQVIIARLWSSKRDQRVPTSVHLPPKAVVACPLEGNGPLSQVHCPGKHQNFVD